jgi:hypothetical protein
VGSNVFDNDHLLLDIHKLTDHHNALLELKQLVEHSMHFLTVFSIVQFPMTMQDKTMVCLFKQTVLPHQPSKTISFI